ncbi:MAG: TonB family protein [Candidatus Cryptobacteroides sp.]|jgi:TonB family protein|nr:TonB family protein [Bacteroidota bacterium]NLN98700.1 TonB family protein [Bacteroidales bacterium]
MKEYLREREKEARSAKITGIVLTVAVHLLGCFCFGFTGLKYLYPPPQERTLIIDFVEDEPVLVQPVLAGRQPQAENVDRTKPIELVQRSESPYQSERDNKTAQATPDNFGDVEVPTPIKEELNRNALFPGMSKKDSSIAPHGARDPRAEFKAGQPSGNTSVGKTDGTANAHLKGRNTLGTLPKPSYSVQEDGIVVVDIWVDNYGNVQRAIAGGEGTTVADKTLWAAARAAAMKAHFSQSADAPALQKGTITYIFKLN